MKLRLRENQEVICPGCKAESTLREWDDTTKEACVTREMRRDFRSILECRNWGRGITRYYMCPKCRGMFTTSSLRFKPKEING